MRQTIIINEIRVVGTAWMGGTCVMDYRLTESDVCNAMDEDEGCHTRESVQSWLDTHAGDFQSIDDFTYDFTLSTGGMYIDIVGDWKSEDNEMIYNEYMFGDEE
jgi:hypothetical protein